MNLRSSVLEAPDADQAGRAAPSRRREPVSIVTVFNDPAVRRSCLDRSIEAHRHQAPAVEYLPIDNVDGSFATAGAALNHAAAAARHDYIAFVHQDVYLHSLTALEDAAGMLAEDESIGLLGAIGVTAEGHFCGRVRDRVILLGDPADEPTPVDCVDELLFMIPRRVLEDEPIAEDPELAWHAYAVEYGLRVRARGLNVCAVDIPLTHNSLTVNLDRLDAAYAAIAARYPASMPLVTPQGSVGGRTALRDRFDILSAHRWRYRWLRESLDAKRGRRATGGSPCLLGDIRLDIDEVLARVPEEAPLLVVSVDQNESFGDEQPAPLALIRRDRPIEVTSAALAEVGSVIDASRTRGPVLVTNLTLEDLEALVPQLPPEPRVLGFRTSIGYWMLIGVAPSAMPAAWGERRATPLGTPSLRK